MLVNSIPDRLLVSVYK